MRTDPIVCWFRPKQLLNRLFPLLIGHELLLWGFKPLILFQNPARPTLAAYKEEVWTVPECMWLSQLLQVILSVYDIVFA